MVPEIDFQKSDNLQNIPIDISFPAMGVIGTSYKHFEYRLQNSFTLRAGILL